MELKGKRIAFLGDSITEGSGVENLDDRYDNRLLRACELSGTFNYGIGGTRFAHQSRPSECPRYDLCFAGRAYNVDKSADIILVYGATNDYGHGDAPFGKREDATPATFYGAVRFLMNLLRTEYPDKTVVFLTPARRYGDECVSRQRANDPEARPLIAYVDAILDVAKDYDIPVLDLYRTLGVPLNEEGKWQTYSRDGLHLNDDAHAILAERVKSFLEAL